MESLSIMESEIISEVLHFKTHDGHILIEVDKIEYCHSHGGPGTCGYKLWAYGKWQIECGVNFETILWLQMIWGSENMYWCCDSCEQSSYCCSEC